MPKLARRSALILLAGLLAGCARDYQAFEPQPLDLAGRAPLALPVSEVVVQSAYRPRGAPPFVEHTFAMTPEAAVRQLLEHRLQAAGGAGSLQAVILDASVEEEPVEPTQTGLRRYLTTEASARLRGRVRVRTDRLDETGRIVNSVTTDVMRTRAILENAPYAERQEIAHQLVRELVDDLDAALIGNLRQSFEGMAAF